MTHVDIPGSDQLTHSGPSHDSVWPTAPDSADRTGPSRVKVWLTQGDSSMTQGAISQMSQAGAADLSQMDVLTHCDGSNQVLDSHGKNTTHCDISEDEVAMSPMQSDVTDVSCDVITPDEVTNIIHDITPPNGIMGVKRGIKNNDVTESRHDVTAGVTSVRRTAGRRCQVCTEEAAGNFFGAMVCLPCKTFFIRCSGEDVSTFRCRRDDTCDITGAQRSRCKACRYRRCHAVGMVRRERPEQVEAGEGQQLCEVCGDLANGIHFGVTSCEGCKKFFRRGLQEWETYLCKNQGRCVINPKTRNDCRYCRYQKCIETGMSREAIKMGRPKKDVAATSATMDLSQCHWTEVSPQTMPQVFNYKAFRPLMLAREPTVGPVRPVMPASCGIPSKHSPPQYHPYECQDPSRAALIHERLGNLNIIPTLSYKSSGGVDEAMETKVEEVSAGTEHTAESDWSSSGSSSGYSSDRDIDQPLDYRCRAVSVSGLAPFIKREAPTEPVISTTGLPFRKWSTGSMPNGNLSHCWTGTPGPHRAQSVNTGSTHTGLAGVAVKVEPGQPFHLTTSAVQHSQSVPTNMNALPDARSTRPHRLYEYRFPAKYWLKPNIPAVTALSEEDRVRVDSILAAYHLLADSFCRQEDASSVQAQHVTEDDLLKRRIVDHTCLTMAFIRAIPGFADVTSMDKYTIFRLTGVQLSILVASLNLYDHDTHSFTRNFYEKDLPSSSPLYHFRNSVLDYAAQLQSLRLDNLEAALLLALVTVATDWPDLQEPAALDAIYQQILHCLNVHITAKHGPTSRRLHNMLGYVPRLRQLGQWHYELTLQDILAHY